jgi:hypothetical protein
MMKKENINMALTPQEKVLKKFEDTDMSSDKLRLAKKKKDDEFYTQRSDIERELSHWTHKFKGKNIICPCDWDIFTKEKDKAVVFSLTVEFSEDSEFDVASPTFYTNKVQKVSFKTFKYQDDQIADLFSGDTAESFEVTELSGDDADKLLQERVTCNFLKYLIGIGKAYGIKTITASGYNCDKDIGIKFQDVDYSKYNLCITNPPFSKYLEFMEIMLAEADRRRDTDDPFDFLILAPFMNRNGTAVGIPLIEKKVFLGYGRQIPMLFKNPDKQSNYHDKKVAVDWITTWDDAQKEVDKHLIQTGIDYELYKNEFEVLPLIQMKDGTNPIYIKSKTLIPDDYFGWIFAPITVLDCMSNEYYEWYLTKCSKYYNSTHPELRPCVNKISDKCYPGKFSGVLFRRKPETKGEDTNA